MYTDQSISERTVVCRAQCQPCGHEHTLSAGKALRHARELMSRLALDGRIDFDADIADPRFSSDYLFGPALGQMFGVLVCRDDSGAEHVLKAFSGQYNAAWHVAGWCDPVFDVATYERIAAEVDVQIKKWDDSKLTEMSVDEARRIKLARRELSRRTMKELHELYTLRNFAGEQRPLTDFFAGGIPTGSGDCCAPKLLNTAALQGWQPLGLVEFYWGATNRSGTREHGCYYANCPDKCGPILGFMLCGAES